MEDSVQLNFHHFLVSLPVDTENFSHETKEKTVPNISNTKKALLN